MIRNYKNKLESLLKKMIYKALTTIKWLITNYNLWKIFINTWYEF